MMLGMPISSVYLSLTNPKLILWPELGQVYNPVVNRKDFKT